MLSLIVAPSGYGKTHNIINNIKNILDSGESRKIFVIVPEQESVKMEAELLTVCGNRINAGVEVINFSRLANRVFREAGGMTYSYIDNAGKDLMTAVILENLKNTCPSFSKVTDDLGYIRTMRNEMDTLRRRGYHGKDIENACQKLINEDRGGTSLAEKLSDFATVFSTYETSLKKNVTDTTDDIVRLADTLEEFDFFEDTYVFIDGFYDYTVPQYSVIEKIMKSCYSMAVTFSMAIVDPEQVFRKTAQAFKTIREIAEKNSVEYDCIELTENFRTRNNAIKALAQSVMTGEEISFEGSEGVSLTEVGTPYDECVFVAREIVKLVKNGASFSEIAICAADIASYASVLENVLESYGISHLTCNEKSVVQMPVTAFAISALEVINSSFYSEHMKSYLKSGYLGLTEDESYILENYVSLWNLGKKSWFSDEDWKLHPRGYEENYSDADVAELEIVNRARRKVFPPLKKLFDGFADRSTVREKAESFAEFFDSLSISEKVENYNKELGRDFGETEYDDEINAWNALLSALDMLVEGAGDLRVGKDRFLKYMRLVLSDMSFGKIPSSLDEVELGDVEFVRNRNIKHLFFIGFNEGVFPSAHENASIFTESERRWLGENDLKIEDDPEEKLLDQSFQFLLAILRPSETLNFVYHTASPDSPKAKLLPSYFSTTVKDVLGIEPVAFDSSFLIPIVPHELTEYLVACDEDMSALFKNEQAFYREAMLLRSFAEKVEKPFHIEGGDVKTNSDFTLSQSRLERYEKCRFSYFVEYMLNTRVRRRAEFSRAEIGSYVHKILEMVLKTLTKDGRDITTAETADIESITRTAASEYIESIASNINESSPKYKYLVENICSFVLLIIGNIKEEFSASLFRPKCFEENLKTSEIVDRYKVELNGGGTLYFNGVIDRVDSYTDENGVEYIRVVDYKTKTGGKSFSLEDVLNGMNLQMLIYLYAFMQTPSDVPRREAGIMYMPASKKEFKASDVEQSDEELLAQIDNDLKRSGMYLDDKRIIDAMESGEKKRFMNLEYDKKLEAYTSNAHSTLATLEEFGIIRRYVDHLFKEVVDSIRDGNIEASPLEDDSEEGSACSYCQYHSICRFEGESRPRIKCDTPLVKMREELGEL